MNYLILFLIGFCSGEVTISILNLDIFWSLFWIILLLVNINSYRNLSLDA